MAFADKLVLEALFSIALSFQPKVRLWQPRVPKIPPLSSSRERRFVDL